MSEDLDSILDTVETLRKTDKAAALAEAVRVTEQYPNEPRAWVTLGYVFSQAKDYQAAIDAYTRAMEVAPEEPAYVFHRGWDELRMGLYERVIKDATDGIALCHKHQWFYYQTAFLAIRAEAYLQLGKKAEARADAEQLPDDFLCWTTTLRRKSDFLALCEDESTA